MEFSGKSVLGIHELGINAKTVGSLFKSGHLVTSRLKIAQNYFLKATKYFIDWGSFGSMSIDGQ